ncbi:MAG TPA: LysR family transcriptional regulator [Dongiaceae bacterium]|jgi:DNA-binding transcriptional LysR family regulator|nr:LysR family transcriptional regulator [Dongiaceae bacterium]
MQRAAVADLSAFVAVATHRSFSRAAAELGLSPSALSHTVRSLEERLDLRLLNRTTRSVAPTEAGERLLERLRPALRDIDDALEDANAFRDKPAGRLRLNVPRSAALLLLAPVMTRFIKAYPQMRLEITAEDRLVDIVASGYDAGVRFGESVERDMVAVRIGPDLHMAVVGAPAYFRRHPKPSKPRDLHGHACIRFRLPSGAIYRWEFEKKGEVLEVEVDGPLTLSDQQVMLQAALDGAGLAIVLESHARPLLKARQLVRVLADWCPPFPGYFLYYPSRRQVPAGLRAFIDMMRQELRKKG